MLTPRLRWLGACDAGMKIRERSPAGAGSYREKSARVKDLMQERALSRDRHSPQERFKEVYIAVVSRLLGLCFLAACVALAGVAIVVNLPWLIAENARLEPWKIPIVWSSDAAAFVCLVGYGLRQVLPSSIVPCRASKLTFKAFFIAAVCDLAFSIYGMIEERWARSGAALAQGQVVAGHSFAQPSGHRRYTLSCQFLDRTGQLQHGWYSLLAPEVPHDVKASVDNGKLPVALKIAYDTKWPSRSWPADVPYSDNNRMYVFSLITLVFSGLLTANLAIWRKWLPGLPPPDVGPFLGATLLLVAAGLLQGW
jgi:hypothetical protein